MRIILFTGKGGVGKTTIAAATALECAGRGLRTIVMSTDAAHSLADAFQKPIDSEPTELADNLYGLEVNVQEELRHNWGVIQSFIVRNLKKLAGFPQIIAEEFAVFPGMDELFSLLRLKRFYERSEFDVALVDCAPTGGTMRMLSFPDVAQWYMQKVFNIQRQLMKVIRPVVGPWLKAELPSDQVYATVKELYGRLTGMKDILTDPKTSTVRLVLNPERMVIKESQRAYAYLSLFGFPVDAAVVNRILPDDADGAYVGRWREIQRGYLHEIEGAFLPLKLIHARQREGELVGQAALAQLGKELYGHEDPARVFVSEPPMQITAEDGFYTLTLKLPFTEKDELEVWVHGDELIVRVRNVKRNLPLPHAIAGLELDDATLTDGRLKVRFVHDNRAAKDSSEPSS